MTEQLKIPAINLKNLQFSYHKQGWQLQIPKLTLAAGQHLFVYGSSGSGKTTLLNLLSGVTQADKGELWLNGQAMHKLSAKQRDLLRAKQIGVVFQQLNLISYLSVLDNCLLSSYFAGKNKAEALQRAEALLMQLAIPQTLWHKPARLLSVGQQQRVAIVRALVPKPTILIADEPTSALDSDNRDSFMQLMLAEASANQCTVIFVSHDLSLQHYFSAYLDMRHLAKGVQAC
ncbi:ABC transporter ATP-binding protein [Rheinheimera sp. WS51]|uniref:ABC transporter ATP-binding protein n=1 Tax=Rheinheimera sp. WS51 TaxID=3425886 RepID=UPI003D8EEAA8